MNYLIPLLRWGGLALMLMLLTLLIRRKQHRKFSWFAAYVVFFILAFVARITASHQSNNAWFIAFWFTDVILGALALLAIRQVFHRVLEVEYRLFRWMRFLLPVTLVLISGFSIYEGIQALDQHQKIMAMVNGFDIGVHAFEATLLFLLLALRFLFPARWLRYEFGILTGYALNSIVTITADLLWLKLGSSYFWFYRFGPGIAYMLTELIWLWVFFVPPKAIEESNSGLEEFHAPVDRQQHVFLRLQEWLRQNRPSSAPR